jgi:hypothetical protein
MCPHFLLLHRQYSQSYYNTAGYQAIFLRMCADEVGPSSHSKGPKPLFFWFLKRILSHRKPGPGFLSGESQSMPVLLTFSETFCTGLMTLLLQCLEMVFRNSNNGFALRT